MPIIKFPTDFPISFNLIVNFEKSDKSEYYSNVNLYDAIFKKYQNFNIECTIKDKFINISELIANIHHELKHVLDSLTVDSDRMIDDFMNIPIINRFKNENSIIRDFVILLYLYSEHEISARNSMLWDKFKRIGITDKELLMKRFKNSYIYEALMKLKSFNAYYFINSKNKEDLLLKTNDLLKSLNKNSISMVDLYNFYKNYEVLFKEKADECLNKVPDIIDELIKDVKYYMENLKFDTMVYNNACINTNSPYFLINVIKDIIDKNTINME